MGSNIKRNLPVQLNPFLSLNFPGGHAKFISTGNKEANKQLAL